MSSGASTQPTTNTNNALSRMSRLLPGKKEQEETEQFITMVRQAAALLNAGRNVQTIWDELAEQYQPCVSPPKATPQLKQPACCFHHGLAHQRINILLGQRLLAGATGPGPQRYWEELSGCLSLAQDTGMPLAQLLERLADALDSGEDAEQARQSAAAGPKSTATLLGFLPIAGLGLSWMMGTTVFDLLATPAGWLLLSIGLTLALGGRFWSSTMIKQANEI